MPTDTDTQKQYEQSGAAANWSMEPLPDNAGLLQSADATLKYETATATGVAAGGATNSIVRYNPTAEFSINLIALATTTIAAIEAAVKTWAAEAAVSKFSLPAGGTVMISELKISQKINDFETLDVSATYYPYVVGN